MKLHLGCGTKKLSGWINIDSVKSCQPDLVHDLSRPLPYADQSAEAIMANGVLEHFDKYARCALVSDWVRVLKVGGTITLEVPDVKKLLSKIRKFKAFDDFIDTLFGENLWESEIYIGHFGNHKWGYSQQTLTEFLRNFGLEPLKVETKGLNICYEGKKAKHIPQEELDLMTIHSHNNKFGAPRSTVLLTEAKAKMQEYQESQHGQR